jgi:cytochrome c-type biogenesis protein CcmH/NrfG
MSGWTIIVIALMVILTATFVAYPLYSAGASSSTPSPPARKARKKRRTDEALEKDLEEEIERQVRALRRKK